MASAAAYRGKMLLIALAALSLNAIASTQAGSQETCSVDLYNRADDTLAAASPSWPFLLKHWRTYGSCDDGALAEGYSNAVVALLAGRWGQFARLTELSERHPDFQRWVIRHIDATAPDDELKKVVENAGACLRAAKGQRLCKAIKTAGSEALAEQKQLRKQ